jgi:hypothetical protein
MISGLALATLTLAFASDSEGEESWKDRFDRCDAERAMYGIEPLTAAERMTWMLGQAPPIPCYLLQAWWHKAKAYIQTYKDNATWTLRIYKATPRKKDGVLIWKVHRIDDFEGMGLIRFEKEFGWGPMRKEVARISERLRVPMAGNCGSNFELLRTTYRFPWDPLPTYTKLGAKRGMP